QPNHYGNCDRYEYGVIEPANHYAKAIEPGRRAHDQCITRHTLRTMAPVLCRGLSHFARNQATAWGLSTAVGVRVFGGDLFDSRRPSCKGFKDPKNSSYRL